jgi:NAD(P)-dependent dehydrogenase (short-subunit alcohol dehydrogenase family)
MRLAGKSAIVTGSARGIGAAFAQALAAEGAKVLVADVLDGARTVEAIQKAGGSAQFFKVDVSDSSSARAMADAALSAFGQIDILVNNAAIFASLEKKGFLDISSDEWDRLMAVNLRGPFECVKAVAPHMIARKSGRIINIASVAGLKVLPQIGAYCMSKAAVVQMTKVLAMEWGRSGINVNAICPGYIDTEINHHHWGTEQGQKLVNMLPRKRVGHPQDLDALLVLLASGESGFVNGAIIAADDGFAL